MLKPELKDQTRTAKSLAPTTPAIKAQADIAAEQSTWNPDKLPKP